MKNAIKRQPTRLTRALDLLQTGAVIKNGDGFIVGSHTVRVINGLPVCDCADFRFNGRPCKHALAATPDLLFACLQFEWSRDVAELEIAGEFYAATLKAMPATLRAFARDAYKAVYSGMAAR